MQSSFRFQLANSVKLRLALILIITLTHPPPTHPGGIINVMPQILVEVKPSSSLSWAWPSSAPACIELSLSTKDCL